MKKMLLVYFIIFGFIIPTLSYGGFDINSLGIPNSCVIDKAEVLNDIEEKDIIKKINEIKKETTAEILVILVNTIDGDYINIVGTEIGQKIGVGKSDIDNGLIILIAVKDKQWNISTGYGLEGILPDIRTKKIGEKNFPNNFKNGNYAKGIKDALTDIKGFLITDKTIISKYDSPHSKNLLTKNNFPGFFLFIYFIIVIILSRIIFNSDIKKKKKNYLLVKFIIVFFISLPILYSLIGKFSIIANFLMWLFSIIITNTKGGNSLSNSSSSNYNSNHSNSSSSSYNSSTSSSSSSSSFGGGSFGGGGSSGKW